MAGINIPGVSDKYKTNDLIDKLMKVERIPLTREQQSLDAYKEQKSAWQDINRRMASLRDSVKNLYSFDNPFNNKLTSSTEDNAVTATANRSAEFGSFKIKVITPATADRFLSGDLDKDYTVPTGTYTFQIADKTVSMHWNGGKLLDFVSAFNKRNTGILKSDIIGMDDGKQALLIESLKTGLENHLEFKDDALAFAKKINIISPVKPETVTFGTTNNEIKNPPPAPEPIAEQSGMPEITAKGVSTNESGTTVPPRGGFMLDLPEKYKNSNDSRIEFILKKIPVTDVTNKINENLKRPELPNSGVIEFNGISIKNAQSETTIAPPLLNEPLKQVSDDKTVFVRMADGSEAPIDPSSLSIDQKTGETKVSLDTRKFSEIQAIVVRNRNTAEQLSISPVSVYDIKKSLGFEPNHPVSSAGDAVIQYNGITIKRPTNTIDDVIPDVTLNIKDKTKNTATIEISPDTDSAKQAVITFIGKYNQTVAELNILSQNKPEIIQELDYLTDDEKKTEEKKLGMFFSDFSLISIKSQLQSIVSANYKYSDTANITMLSQIGISTEASGSSTGYTPGKLRGYLEVDEKKLDTSLKNDLDDVKKIFGYDSDGDLIIDSGIGYAIDRQLIAYTQSGGIITGKTRALDSQIQNSKKKIAKLETQLDTKESTLKEKYGKMESSLNSLESQKDTISNFTNRQNNQ